MKQFVEGVKKPFFVEQNNDPTRLVLVSPFSGEEVASALEEAGFVAEMSSENKVVFIVTPYNYLDLNGLKEAVNGLDLSSFHIYDARDFEFCAHKTPTLLTFGGAWEEVPLTEAVGRKLYVEVGLYPPGVPLAYSHDVLTLDVAGLLQKYPRNRFGLNGNNVYVIK